MTKLVTLGVDVNVLALLAAVLGVCFIVVAVFGLAGVWWALLAAGAAILAGAYLMYDPSPDRKQRR